MFGSIKATGGDSGNWNTAYGWGNHASAGYSTASGVEDNANNYSLPVAGSSIGGVKSGTDISVDGSGNVSVNNDSHTHDGRYYTETEINTYFERGYITHQSANSPAVGWYTIAQNTGDRALGEFQIWDTHSSRHQSVIFNAAHHFGTDDSNSITVLANSSFGTDVFRYIRIKENGTYDGAAIQVYIDNAASSVHVAIVGANAQESGWALVDWLADSTSPSQISGWASATEKSKIDLDNIHAGGIATTGKIYAGGATTQYRVLTTNDEGSGNGLDADTLDGNHASAFSTASGVEDNADVTDTANVVAALTAGSNVQIAANGTISATNTTYTVGDGGLTQKNFTTTLKNKLDGIAASATNVTNNNQLTNGAGYLTSETFGSSDVVLSLSGDDVTAGESITLAGGLSYSGTTLTSANTTYSAGTGLTLTGTTFSVTANTYATAAQGTKADAALPKAGGTMTGDLIIGTAASAGLTQAFGNFDQLKFDNSHSDSARGPNKIVMHDNGAAWRGGFGIHSGTVAYYSGDKHIWYKTGSSDSYTERMTLDGSGNLSIDGTLSASGYNKSDWDTAYTDRNKWDGGSTGLTASTGRTSLGLGTAATAATGDFATAAQGTTADAALPKAGGTMTGSLTIGDGSAATRLIIKRVDSTVADDIQFYNGTTRVGEIGTTDTTWLRINQNTSKNIYTPRYIRADNGFFVDGTAKGINGSGNFIGGTITGASDANVSNWDTAYGWGDHSAAGYGDATQDYVGEQIGAISIPSGNAIIDWTADQGATNIHSGNYINTTYTVGDGGLTQNNFTNADHTKLNGIETGATADQTAAEIKTAIGTGNGKLVPAAGSAGQFLKHDGTFGTPSYTTNTNTTYSAGSGLDLTSTTFSVEPDLRDGITHVGKDSNNYIQFDSTNGRIDFYAGGVFVARMESDGDLHIKGDVIAFSDIF